MPKKRGRLDCRNEADEVNRRFRSEKAVELDIIESIGRESIRVILKKANLDLGNKSAGVFPPKKIQPS